MQNIDFYGNKINLTLNNQDKIKTKFGGYMTLLSLFFIFSLMWFLGNDIFYKLYPITLTETKLSDNYFEINYNFSNSPIAVALTDENNNLINIKNYFEIEFYFKNLLLNINNSYTGESTMKSINDKKIDMKKCEFDDFNDKIDEIQFNDSQLNNYFCPNANDITLKGNWIEKEISYFSIFIKKCNINKNRSCKSDENIDKFIKDKMLNFNVNILQPTIHFANFSHPISYSVFNYYRYLATDKMKFFYFSVEKHDFITDTGLIFTTIDNQTIFEAYQVGNDELNYNEEKRTIMTVEIYSSNKKKIYIRSYIKLGNILAGLGGIIKIFSAIFIFLNSIFGRIRFLEIIIDELFYIRNSKMRRQTIFVQNNEFNDTFITKNKFQRTNKKINENMNFSDIKKFELLSKTTFRNQYILNVKSNDKLKNTSNIRGEINSFFSKDTILKKNYEEVQTEKINDGGEVDKRNSSTDRKKIKLVSIKKKISDDINENFSSRKNLIENDKSNTKEVVHINEKAIIRFDEKNILKESYEKNIEDEVNKKSSNKDSESKKNVGLEIGREARKKQRRNSPSRYKYYPDLDLDFEEKSGNNDNFFNKNKTDSNIIMNNISKINDDNTNRTILNNSQGKNTSENSSKFNNNLNSNLFDEKKISEKIAAKQQKEKNYSEKISMSVINHIHKDEDKNINNLILLHDLRVNKIIENIKLKDKKNKYNLTLYEIFNYLLDSVFGIKRVNQNFSRNYKIIYLGEEKVSQYLNLVKIIEKFENIDFIIGLIFKDYQKSVLNIINVPTLDLSNFNSIYNSNLNNNIDNIERKKKKYYFRNIKSSGKKLHSRENVDAVKNFLKNYDEDKDPKNHNIFKLLFE